MSADAREDLKAFIRSLSPQERYEIGIGPPPTSAPTPDNSVKLQPALDQVAEADVPRIVQACRAGLAAIARGGQDVDSVGPLRAVHAGLADLCVANSAYRRKSITHSVRICAEYLQSQRAAEKRAETKRRVPASRPTTASPQGTFLVPQQEQPPVDQGEQGGGDQ